MLFALLQTELNQPPTTNFQMTPWLWIGFGFLAVLLIFLIVSFFAAPNLTNDQRRTIKFLIALCAGFSGGFLTGGSLFQAKWTSATATIGISGTAGVAIFFAVFFTYNKFISGGGKPDGDNGLRIDIPTGWTFQQVANTVSSKDGAGTLFEGFTDAQKQTVLRNQPVTGETYINVLETLGSLAQSGVIPPYTVTKQGGSYILKVK